MSLIHWDEELYTVGIRKLDKQHEKLVGLINALHEQKESADHEFIDRIFTTLVMYTKQHFVDEEKLLKKLHYPVLEGHHQQHLLFIKTLGRFKDEYDRHPEAKNLVPKLSQFLSDWLINHIMVEDKAYAKYLES